MPVKAGGKVIRRKPAGLACFQAPRHLGVQRFSIPDEAGDVRRRIVAKPAAQADDPLAAFNREGYARARSIPDPQADMRIGIARRNFDQAGHIANVDVDLRNARLLIPQGCQPVSQPRPSAAGVDHQIGVDRLVRPVIRSHENAGDPLAAVR